MLEYKIYRLKWWLAKWYIFKYPVHVDFELSSVCNLMCKFCPHHSEKTDFKKEFMDYDLFTKCIDEIAGKVPSIKLNLRGESTLHPKFIPMLRYVRGKFTDIRLNTNGQYDYDLNWEIAKTCTNISVSVDAYTIETYRKIKGVKNIQTVKQNIHYLTMLAKGKLTLSYVIGKDNKSEFENFKERYADQIERGDLKIFCRIEKDRHGDSDTKGRDRKNCFMPNRRLVIAANGDIYPCCVQWYKPFFILGNVSKNNIIDIWQSNKLKILREDLSKNIFSHPSCEKCLSSESYV